MSFYDSEYSNDEEFEHEDNIEAELKACKAILESGYIYDSIERIEDLIQTCMDNDLYEDALYLIDKLQK